MFLDATDPMHDAYETIRATDVISDDKKRILFQGLENLRRRHCREGGGCDCCATRRRCLNDVADLLGS